jgi:hypothetical protein
VPLRLKVQVHLAEVIEVQDNLVGRLDSHASAMQVSVDGEEGQADQKEMEQGLA